MNTEDALRFLSQHEPFPDGDLELDQPFLDGVKDVMEHFRKNKDNRCVPLFVKCLSFSTLMGLEPHIETLLLEVYPREIVIPALVEGMNSSNEGTKYRAIELSGWFRDRSVFIEPYKKAMVPESPESVRAIVAESLEFIASKEDIPWLTSVIEKEPKIEIRDVLTKVLLQAKELE